MGWANRERESWETEYFAVVGNVLRNVQLLHGAGCTIVCGPQRPVMIAATCQVAETTGASHYLPSSPHLESHFCPIGQDPNGFARSLPLSQRLVCGELEADL